MNFKVKNLIVLMLRIKCTNLVVNMSPYTAPEMHF